MGEVFDLSFELEKLVQPEVRKKVESEFENDLSFPYYVMTGAAGYFANVYSDYIEAPPQFLFMGYLTALGAVLSRSVKISSVLQTQPRLFTVLLGESASDRKSTTLSVVNNHFKATIDNYSSCWSIGSAEGLHNVLQKPMECHYPTDAGEAPGTLLIHDELKSFVNKCKIESSVLLPCVNSLFESNRYESHTKKKSIIIEDAHLSMLAASTRNTYERIYTDQFIDIGFPNRIFLVTGTANRQFSFPEKIPAGELEMMQNNLLKVLRHVGNGLELKITKEAKEFYHGWYLGLNRSVHSKRLDTYSIRLMELLAVNNLKCDIDLEITRHAVDLCDWQLEVRRVHDPIDADNKSAKMEEAIRRVLGKRPMTDRELKQYTNARRSGLWVYENSIKNLRKSKEISWDKSEKKWFLKDG
jgi:hypothetical protein